MADGSTQPVPRSDGSEVGDGEPAGAGSVRSRVRGREGSPAGAGMSDDFDSDEFREFLTDRRHRERGRGRGRGEEEDEWKGGGSTSKPPEWDGDSTPFQDWRSWLRDEQGGHRLLVAMGLPENFGDDTEEDLLSSLAKVTHHIRRDRQEGHRAFFNRREAMRRVSTHQVALPDAYKGFLVINALDLSEQDIKNMMNFNRGSIATKDVKEWIWKHETKLMAKEVGVEVNKTKAKTTSGASSTSPVHHIQADETLDYTDENEILETEAVLDGLNDEDEGDAEEGTENMDEEALDEREIREVLNTMYQKRTFSQSLKLKKAKELARGYCGWKGTGKDKGKSGKGKLARSMESNIAISMRSMKMDCRGRLPMSRRT